MPSLNEIRSTFLDYFGKADHAVVPSAPLVPQNDPTLLFVNAGMVPFKNVFTGAETPAHPRAASSQKCVRAGGKHNDLDNVGYTARHHTFFEMLGNFSFGDYFKEQAIHHAWTLLTGEFKLPKEKLLVTVYHTDDEAADLWKKIAGLSDEKIIRIPTSDNFWSMGDTGPCGPCSEIFYDHGPSIAGGPPGSPDEDGDRFIEIWNLVFMQFEQLAGGERVSLPKPSIDTGMGLERVAAVLQGVHNNYDVDLFKALIAASVELTGVKAEGAQAPSHRVIADHLRSSSFLLADGVGCEACHGGAENWIVIDIALLAVPLAIIVARIYHVLTHPGFYFGDGADFWAVFRIWEGGIAIYGALIGGAVGAWLGCRWTGIRFWSFADALAPGLIIAQAMGRLGNWFNHELFGLPTDLPWGLEIESTNAAFPPGLAPGTLFHPTFLYEMIWNLLGAAVLLW
ncbi:prolipoprotein diacylglyceryl transferase family protein, partial [uncultured Caulobacter sp.]|uniref:prolipoprotein diacylglyceryl transferase family protein n=1 Tax=uncultured Caulobacter sp. TaxID=158749 RepID=UPI0026148139